MAAYRAKLRAMAAARRSSAASVQRARRQGRRAKAPAAARVLRSALAGAVAQACETGLVCAAVAARTAWRAGARLLAPPVCIQRLAHSGADWALAQLGGWPLAAGFGIYLMLQGSSCAEQALPGERRCPRPRPVGSQPCHPPHAEAVVLPRVPPCLGETERARLQAERICGARSDGSQQQQRPSDAFRAWIGRAPPADGWEVEHAQLMLHYARLKEHAHAFTANELRAPLTAPGWCRLRHAYWRAALAQRVSDDCPTLEQDEEWLQAYFLLPPDARAGCSSERLLAQGVEPNPGPRTAGGRSTKKLSLIHISQGIVR